MFNISVTQVTNSIRMSRLTMRVATKTSTISTGWLFLFLNPIKGIANCKFCRHKNIYWILEKLGKIRAQTNKDSVVVLQRIGNYKQEFCTLTSWYFLQHNKPSNAHTCAPFAFFCALNWTTQHSFRNNCIEAKGILFLFCNHNNIYPLTIDDTIWYTYYYVPDCWINQ